MKIAGIFFLQTAWLWACLAIPFLYAIGRYFISRRKERFKLFASESMWSKIAPELDWNLAKRKLLAWSAALLFLFLAAARPQWGETEETVKTTGLDLMLVVDVSQSMLAEDVVPNRLKKAQHFIRRFLERTSGDRVGLVAFAGNSILLSPLTTDLDYVAETSDTLTTDSVTLQGTDLGAGLETALKALERGAEDNSGKESQAPVSRSIILISDGEDNEDRIKEVSNSLRKEKLKLYVFGVGTEKGGPIPVRNPEGDAIGFKRDRSGNSVTTQFQSASLEKLAADSGGQFWRITPSENELDALMTDLGSLARGDFAEKKVTIRYERFQWPLAVSILLFFLELSLPSRRKVVAALLLFGAFLSGSSAQADEWNAYRQNGKALKAFEADRVSEAKELFGSAQVEDPGSPILRFNQGVIHLKEEKWTDADRAFSAASEAAKLAQRPDLAAEALYNQGIARTADKRPEDAADSYLAALVQNAFDPKPEAEAKIRKNLELLFQSQQSQGQGSDPKSKDDKSDKGDPKDQKNQSGKNSSDGDADQKKKEKEGEDAEKKKPEKYKESNGKREFKSEKLSPEDAGRVMSELSRREKDLQEKMKRSKGRPQPLDKDW
ncbi:MAG: VWA domain-containing protein [Cryobacterium sp.]|nr:VWA domain-containing protein [Oligoflexia bacterium]